MDRLGHTKILTAFTTSLLGLAALAALTGCDKRALFFDYDTDDSVARAELQVNLSVDGGVTIGDVETKAVVSGTTLDIEGQTYGIIACEHEDTPSQYKTYDADNAGLYGNIQAKYIIDRTIWPNRGFWNYSYASSSTSYFRPLYFVAEDPTRHMDIYAYAPWKSGVTIESGYTYNLEYLSDTELPDLMYATYEDAGGNPTNKDIAIVDGATIPMTIKFHHALSRIAFHFKLANKQNTGLDEEHAIRLFKILLVKADTSSTPLIPRGNMNLLDGSITTNGVSKQAQTVTYSQFNYSINDRVLRDYDIIDEWKTFNMLVRPTEYLYSGDFSFVFYFNGNDAAQALGNQYVIQRSDLLHPDGITYGFQPGYCYHFYFIIDNYIHLQNVVVNTDWELTDETELKV